MLEENKYQLVLKHKTNKTVIKTFFQASSFQEACKQIPTQLDVVLGEDSKALLSNFDIIQLTNWTKL